MSHAWRIGGFVLATGLLCAAPGWSQGTGAGAPPNPMASAYAAGQLPEAAAAVDASADERARIAAELIAQRDDYAVAALLAAVEDAGFGVRDHAGSVQRRGAASQGLLLEGWELAAAAKMYGEGRSVSLAEFSAALGSLPGLAGAPLDRLVLQALRAHARGGNAPLRAWARLIVELGRASAEPYDLLEESDPARIQLDPIQTLLILRRLFGDLYAADAAGAGAGGEAYVPAVRSWPRSTGAASVPGARVAAALRAYGGSSACKTGADGSFVLDVAALGITTGFGQVVDYVEQALGEKAGAVTGFKRVSGIASLVLAYGKLLATYAALETEITTTPAGVLVRTKNREPGARKELVARLIMKTGKWEEINCLRTALNVATGLDVSLASDGPVEGATVRWHLDAGGGMAAASAALRGREARDVIVQFAGTGPRIQDAGTKAGPGGSGVAVGDLTEAKTGADGRASVLLEGAPQRNALIGKVSPVMKYAKVRTTVKLKSGELRGDMVDALGQALGGAAALLTLPAELIARTDWASTAVKVVPVQDWEECTGGWQGTITYHFRYALSDEEVADGGTLENQEIRTANSMSFTVQAQVALTPKVNPDDPDALLGHATGSAVREARMISSTRGQTTCVRASQLQGLTSESSEIMLEEGTADGPVEVRLSIGRDRYGISFDLPPFEGTSTHRSRSETRLEGPAGTCTVPDPIAEQESSPFRHVETPPPVDDIPLDPKNPNVLRGTREFRQGDEILTITWDLARCG